MFPFRRRKSKKSIQLDNVIQSVTYLLNEPTVIAQPNQAAIIQNVHKVLYFLEQKDWYQAVHTMEGICFYDVPNDGPGSPVFDAYWHCKWFARQEGEYY